MRMVLLNIRSISNKTFAFNEQILSHELDLLFMTETWLNAGELGPHSEVCPKDYIFFNMTLSVGRGGGLATIYRNNFKCCLLQVQVELYCHSATCGDIQWNEMSCLTGPRCYINTDIQQ